MANKFLTLLALFGACMIVASNAAEASGDAEENSAIVTLTDDNFEHLTQATTGSTTGDWFIKFYSPTCPHCVRMQPAWEDFAKEMDGELNVAELNCREYAITCQRFQIRGYPSLLFLRKGRYYKYKGARTPEGFKEFATSTYDQAEVQDTIPEEAGVLGGILASVEKFVTSVETEMKENTIRTTVIIVFLFAAFTISCVLIANAVFTRLETKMDKVKRD